MACWINRRRRLEVGPPGNRSSVSELLFLLKMVYFGIANAACGTESILCPTATSTVLQSRARELIQDGGRISTSTSMSSALITGESSAIRRVHCWEFREYRVAYYHRSPADLSVACYASFLTMRFSGSYLASLNAGLTEKTILKRI